MFCHLFLKQDLEFSRSSPWHILQNNTFLESPADAEGVEAAVKATSVAVGEAKQAPPHPSAGSATGDKGWSSPYPFIKETALFHLQLIITPILLLRANR